MPSGLLRHYVCMYAYMYVYLQGGLSLYICNKLGHQFVCGVDRDCTLFLPVCSVCIYKGWMLPILCSLVPLNTVAECLYQARPLVCLWE